MDKVIRAGKVAVLYSPGYGAGWYSWNRDFPQCLFDPEIVAMVEGGKREAISDFADHKYGGTFYSGGGDQLRISWVAEGARFEIEEYDGNENVHVFTDDEGLVA